MKLSLPKNRKAFNGYEIDAMRQVVASAKEDECSVEDYAAMAIREAIRKENGYIKEIFKASASIAGNGRISDAFGFGSLSFDVWVEATAETSIGFVKVAAYLTDIWQIDGETEISMFKEIYRAEPVKIRL